MAMSNSESKAIVSFIQPADLKSVKKELIPVSDKLIQRIAEASNASSVFLITTGDLTKADFEVHFAQKNTVDINNQFIIARLLDIIRILKQ